MVALLRRPVAILSAARTDSDGWTAENELSARHALQKGTLKAFYFLHLAEACTCCAKSGSKWVRQTLPHDRKDWDRALGINKDATVKFEKPADLGAEPPDLKHAAKQNAFH